MKPYINEAFPCTQVVQNPKLTKLTSAQIKNPFVKLEGIEVEGRE
jgi:hypothetical protein